MTDTVAAPAPGRRRLATGLVVLAWCAAVGVAASAAWVVVDRAGISLLGGSGPGLSGGVPGSTSTATSAATPSSGRTASLATAGGRVTATCTPAGVITLNGAIPATAWRVETKGSGTPRLQVEFRKGGAKVEVLGVCRSGSAVLTLDRSGRTISTSTSRPAPSTSTTDDHGGNRSGSGGSSSSGGSGSGSGSGGGGGSSEDGGSHGGSSGGSSGGSKGSSGGSSGGSGTSSTAS